MRLLRNMLSSRSIDTSEPFGLPTGSLTVMSLVAANPGSSQSELAGLAGITGPSLVGIIDELETRGLVSRKRSSTDRRRNMVVLTDQGQEKVRTMFDTVSQIEAPIREELGERDLKTLVDLLDRALLAMTRT